MQGLIAFRSGVIAVAAMSLVQCASTSGGRPPGTIPPTRTWSEILKGSAEQTLPGSGKKTSVEPIPAKQCKGNVAIGLVIDKSRGVGDKLEVFKKISSNLVSSLKDDSELAIIAFDASPFELVHLVVLNRESREKAISRLRMLAAHGSTNLLSALDSMRRQLFKSRSPCKQIVIVSDGELPDLGSFYGTWAEQSRLSGVPVSFGVLGNTDKSASIREMVVRGGGFFVLSLDAAQFESLMQVQLAVAGNF